MLNEFHKIISSTEEIYKNDITKKNNTTHINAPPLDVSNLSRLLNSRLLVNKSIQNKTINSGIRRIDCRKKSEKSNIPTSEIDFNTFQLDTNIDQKQDKNYKANYLAESFMKEYKFIMIGKQLYVWDNDNKLYKAFNNEYADYFIRRNAPQNSKSTLFSGKINEIVKWIKSSVPEIGKEYIESFKNKYIIFNNGLYDIKEGKLVPLTPQYPVTYKLNVNFDNNVSNNEYFETFIDSITRDDIDFYHQIQELFGYVISEIRNIKVLPMLIGPKDSGKSVCLQLLELIVGEDNYSSVSLKQLKRPEFLAELQDKKLNTCGEISKDADFSSELIKQLSGGDTIMAKSLYNDPKKFKNTAALVFAGNNLPSLKNSDSHNALLKRICLINFSYRVPKNKQDPFLINKIRNNLEYIAQWSIEGLIRLISNNYHFTIPEKSKRVIDHAILTSNSVESFINDNCEFDEDFKMHKQDLLESYFLFCKENEITAQSDAEFERVLIENYGVIKSSKKERLGKPNPQKTYLGITIKDSIIGGN